MEQTRKAGMIDVVSFNTLIKAHLQLGDFAKGRALMEGLQPNKVTFNEFINAMIALGRSWDFHEIWGCRRCSLIASGRRTQVLLDVWRGSLGRMALPRPTRPMRCSS